MTADITDPWMRVAFGATSTRDKDDLEQAKKALHDQVIEALGAARTGGVTWRWWPAPTGLRVLRSRGVWPQAGTDKLVRFLRANPGGYLVAAMAPCDQDGCQDCGSVHRTVAEALACDDRIYGDEPTEVTA